MQIERRIIIGCIVSTDYLRQIRDIWNSRFIEDPTARKIANWCWEYFEQYDKAPNKEIENIFFEKVKTGLQKDTAEEIEQDILPSLSDEYENESNFNLDYLLDQTHQHFTERHLALFNERIQGLVEEGKRSEAEGVASNFKPLATSTTTGLDLSNPITLDRVAEAFDDTRQVVLRYPKQLGEFWNSQFVRGGFVALMASEKRGKTFLLMDMAMRACQQKQNVVFFQAGDMTEGQQLKRMCIYLAQKSDQQKYSGVMLEPVRDCILNQRNDCDKKEREGDFGIFDSKTTDQYLRKEVTLEELKPLYEANPDYKACFNCDEYPTSKWGCVWLKQVDTGAPLQVKEAQQAMEDFFIKNHRKFKLSSYANGTLTIKEMMAQMNVWERQNGFVPDVIVIDYADLLVPEGKTEFRHQQNEIWKGLRSMSQEKHALVITATQADAKSYEVNRLKLSNFSEDKRKYAHVTATFGLNQDPNGREKKLGIMRINEIIVREGDFDNSNEVYVLQNLRRGRPFIASYW